MNREAPDQDEGYPGIAHDFETMRLQRDEFAAALRNLYCANGHLDDPMVTAWWMDRIPYNEDSLNERQIREGVMDAARAALAKL